MSFGLLLRGRIYTKSIQNLSNFYFYNDLTPSNAEGSREAAPYTELTFFLEDVIARKTPPIMKDKRSH